MQTKTLIAALLALGLLTACTQAAPESEAAVAEVAVPEPEAEAPEASIEEDEPEADLGRPWNEQGMYCCHYEVMTYPPPLGSNGETTTFDSDSTSAHGFTGAVTFSVLPFPDGWKSPTHPVRMQGANGLSYDLDIVADGGVDAIGTLDWSEIMMRPIGMADYLSEAAEEAGTLVFVFEVKPADAVEAAPAGPSCGRAPRYIALTAQWGGPGEDYLTLATFSDGPWPANADRLCGVFNYAPGVISAGD
jgi:hypothetical protein